MSSQDSLDNAASELHNLDSEAANGGDSCNSTWMQSVPIIPVAVMSVGKHEERYNMNHINRGKAVIFNHKNFTNGEETRDGTEKDEERLTDCFQNLGFEVIVYQDLKKLKLLEILEKISMQDHSKSDCLIVVVLTHGKQDKLYAADNSYHPDDIWNNFTANSCPSLAGKPKIFFIQESACRGNKKDSGTIMACDNRRDSKNFSNQEISSYTVPNLADFLIAFSTPPGYVSWRSPDKGSWFVDSLVTILNEKSSYLDLQSIMTLVTREVALNFESTYHNKPEFNRMKQVPMTSSTLTRYLYFSKKQ